ncbi:hypothetical protein PTKIN_Ptkin11bG0064200 [Pterospermum kingtungense]
MASSPPSSSIGNGGGYGGGTISTLHPDIIQAHILTRLDGPDLASAACVSSHLRSLSTKPNLWSDICHSTWPSVNQPRVEEVISTFPSGHRSFFFDSFPFPNPQRLKLNVNSLTLATELISAVDIYYQENPIFSKVQEMATSSSWFLSSPFRVDLLDPKHSASSPIQHGLCIPCNDDTWLKHLEENLSLSWIVIDPTRKKAVNMSSKRAVSVQRHWMTGNVQVRFGTVMEVGDERRGSSGEMVECGLVITCGGGEGGEMEVREVSMVMEDMEGKGLSGKESLMILKGVMESGRRKKRNGGKNKYEEFVNRKRERKEKEERKDRVLELVWVITVVVGYCFRAFWSLTLSMF